MADLDETTKVTGVDDIQRAVETANSEDESLEDVIDDDEIEDQSDDDSDADDKGADESDESDESDDDDKPDEGDKSDEDEEEDADKEDKSKKPDKESTERKFKQFAATDDKDYIANLEKGYSESSSESLRLKQDLDTATTRNEAIMTVIARDAKLADAFNKALAGGGDSKEAKDESSPLSDPFLTDAKTKWQETSQKEAADFVEANPEVVSDPNLKSKVERLVKMFSKDAFDNEKRLMTSGEALRKAYASLGLEDKSQKDSKAEVVNRMKESAAPTRRGSSKKKAKAASSGFTDAQRQMAEKMGYPVDKLEKFANTK